MLQLREYQQKAIDEIAQKYRNGYHKLIFQAATGAGKCLGKNTPVLKYDGTIEMVQNIKVGDRLMGPDSRPRRVLSVCTGHEMLYKIQPVKGESYVVNESHIISLKITGLNGKNVTSSTGKKYTTGDIVNISVKDYLKCSPTFKHCAKGWRTGVNFNNEYILAIPPYILGIWLSEGTIRRPDITTVDKEIVSAFTQYVESIGCAVIVEDCHGTRCPTYKCVSTTKKWHSNVFKEKLRSLNLIMNKHIPQEYLTASREDRLMLLAGIIDTDGYNSHDNFEIVSKFKVLANDIVFLARSLGFAAYMRKCQKTCTNTGAIGTYYRILISGDTYKIPLQIERKHAHKRQQKKDVLVTGITVTPLSIDEYFGFTIDGDHLFLLGDFTVTHNTVTFSGLIHRFIENTGKKVLISVHREELLEQARKALYKWYGIIAEPIVAGVRYRNPNAQVYVTMVQTARNRLKKNPRWFGDIGMLIIDEAHLANHKPLLQHFDNNETLIVGFTATPISSSKRHPMNEDYADIVCAIDIPELIKRGALVQNKTYHIKGIERSSIKIRNGEFDAEAMYGEFKKGKYVDNVIKGYEEHAMGKKTLVFNCNVEHSEMVNNAFLSHGYNSKHLDGATNKSARKEILQWFHETPNAILQNVGVLTAGFDEPSTQCIIMNRSTLSLPLWLQCTGRGSRPYLNKEDFTIIDMGGNALDHGDWCSPRDWHYLFHNPPKPGKENPEAVAPIKLCDSCDAIIPIQCKICPECGSLQKTAEVKYDKESVEFELLTNELNIQEINLQNHQYGRNPYASLHTIKQMILQEAKAQQLGMNDEIAYNLLELYQQKVQEWCRIERKNYDEWHKRTTSEWFFDELQKQFHYEPQKLTIEL